MFKARICGETKHLMKPLVDTIFLGTLAQCGVELRGMHMFPENRLNLPYYICRKPQVSGG